MQRIAALQLCLSRTAALVAAALAVCLLVYGALLLLAVSNAASRTAAQREMRALASQISALETRYFEAARSITPERAADMGFAAPASSVTVFATAASKVLTLRGAER